MLSTFRLVRRYRNELHKINKWLNERQLPAYYLGGISFNTEYRLYPPPRFTDGRLDEVYLIHLPDSPDERKLTYKA